MKHSRILSIILLLASVFLMPTHTNAQEFPFQAPERSKEAYQDLVKEISDVVGRLRGHEWKHDVKAGIYSRQQLMELLLKDAEEQRQAMQAQSLILHKMGLVSRDFDLYEAMIGLYGQGIAGFFNPDNKELNIISDTNPLARPMMQQLEDLMMRLMLGVSQEEMILAHELTHALDDQYYDLMNIIDMTQADSEQQLVRLAITEGTAVSVQYDFLFRKQGIKSYANPQLKSLLDNVPGTEALPNADGMEQVPPMVVREMLWPYTIGNRLVFEARKRDDGKWDTVNKMFEDLPASSEQVLHPEKYLDEPRDLPVTISLPSGSQLKALMGDGWRELGRDVMGEFRLWLYLEDMFRGTRSGKDVAKGASEGWDGDSMVFMSHGDDNDKIALLWVSRWDTEEDADQFFKTYRHILIKKYKEAQFANQGDDSVFQFNDPNGDIVRIEKRGADVVLLEGVPRDSHQNILNICWSAPRTEWTRPPHGTMKPSVEWGK